MQIADLPLVSIGVPVYNGGSGIEAALNSILAQTYPNIEVVVSDNASTDSTQEICERIYGRDSRVDYLRQPANMGPLANAKAVLERAKGDYFMWLGHDDWLSDRYIEVCADTLTENADVSLACGQAVYYQDGVEVFKGTDVQLNQESPQERVVAYYGVVGDNGTFYGLMRREQLAKVRMKAVMGNDWMMIASIAFLGKVVTLHSALVHRERGGISRSYENIAELLGLPKFQALFPHVAIAYFAFREIAWSDPIYTLDRIQRVRLAWKCQRSIRLRHGASLWELFRRVLSLGKQYGKSIIVGGAKEMGDKGRREA